MFLFAGLGHQAYASFHLWMINEVFSNGDGTIQYIELTTTFAGQEVLSGHSLVSTDGGSNQNVLNFADDLVGDTQNKTVLIATSKFATESGLTPDVIIPEQFIFTGGGELNFAEGADTLSFTREQLPLNDMQSIDCNITPQTASPQNFSGETTIISSATYATLNLDTAIMNVPVVDAPGIGILNATFGVNLETFVVSLLEFFIYGNEIGVVDNPAEFQSSSVLHVPRLILGNEIFEFNLTLIGDDPIVFDNLEILSVTNISVEPEVNELQESISRGEAEYATLCVACHGASGGGGIGPNLLTSSFNAFDPLRDKIDLDMSQGNAGGCRDSEASSCATDIANFVLNDFQQ
tara:strand:+ start:1214 stop:2260 length:1047 start_codon:yes stop_codon:yes gene_type:complete